MDSENKFAGDPPPQTPQTPTLKRKPILFWLIKMNHCQSTGLTKQQNAVCQVGPCKRNNLLTFLLGCRLLLPIFTAVAFFKVIIFTQFFLKKKNKVCNPFTKFAGEDSFTWGSRFGRSLFNPCGCEFK